MHSGTGHWTESAALSPRVSGNLSWARHLKTLEARSKLLALQTSQIGLGHVVPPSYFPFNLIRTETDPQAASFTQHLEGQEMEIN